MIYEDKIVKDIVKKYFDTNIIKKNDTIIVGLSGGSDSMCLMDILYKLSDIYKFNICAIHIHHGIRNYEADNDLAFTERYCKNFKIPFTKKYVNAKEYAERHSLSIEEAARILRYKELHQEWKTIYSKTKKGDVYVAVAHHMKDQVETIVHNMIRGTGLRGIAGMNDRSDYIIRPLLNIKKEEITKYIAKYDIPYVEDSTNNDINYTRNFIRKEILEKFEKINDKAYEHIIDLSKQAEEAINYIEFISKQVYKGIASKKNDEIIIDLKTFKNTSHIIKAHIIREAFNDLISTLKDITKVNIEDIILLTTKEKGGHLDLPYNITVDKKKNDLIFRLNKENISMSKRKKK